MGKGSHGMGWRPLQQPHTPLHFALALGLGEGGVGVQGGPNGGHHHCRPVRVALHEGGHLCPTAEVPVAQ